MVNRTRPFPISSRVRRGVFVLLLLSVGSVPSRGTEEQDPVPVPLTPQPGCEAPVSLEIQDEYTPVPANRQKLGGLLGERMQLNRSGHLLQVEVDALLAPFENRPGQKWVGEHVGKLVDAAALDHAYLHDPEVAAKYGEIRRRLLATQLPDGYLGTYAEPDRWTGWDVWVHKYAMIGLLRHYETTRELAVLKAVEKIGDLLCRTFGSEPGKRNILEAGEHMGMAATCILQPMVGLYRATRSSRYLDFCHYLVDAIDRPGGPELIRSLTTTGDVYHTANAKAYEMLSNLIGMLELYRVTGEQRLLVSALRAWEDIVARRLYIIGTSSAGERFLGAHDLPAYADRRPNEGCVTVTWAQLNLQLLRLTGEARFADELEKTVFNGLLGAQDPQSGLICFYAPLIGRKSYAGGLSYCCVSSVARGVTMIPSFTWGQSADGGLMVVLYTPGQLTLDVGPTSDPVRLEVTSKTDFPLSGKLVLTLTPEQAIRFPVRLRVPAWTSRFVAWVNDKPYAGEPGTFLTLEREWCLGDTIAIEMEMDVRLHSGGESYPEYLAVQRGPQVLSLERSLNPKLSALSLAALASDHLVPILTLCSRREGTMQQQAYCLNGLVSVRSADQQTMRPEPGELVLVPFADSIDGSVWIAGPRHAISGPVALTAFGTGSASRRGTMHGSICDELDTYRNTENFHPELDATVMDWYAVTLGRPETIGRVVYIHGKVDPNVGGWFCTEDGAPEIQVQREPDGPWKTVVRLESYPDVPDGQVPAIADFTRFQQYLPEQQTVVAIRILGRPGKGSRLDKGRSSSCAELQAYRE